MALSLTVQKFRDELLGNCKYAIERLKVSEHFITTGYTAFNNTSGDSGSNTLPTTSMVGGSTFNITNVEIVQNFMILTHGVLIQEWEHFLYGVFADGVIYYLNGYNLGTPKFKVNFRNLKQTKNIIEMHRNISLEAKESLQGYDDLFDQSRILFKTKTDDTTLFQEMQKQIRIRHIFQHNRGKIRENDLEDIGRPGGCFEILNEEGNIIKRQVDKEVFLSRPEIQKLFETIEKYSELFLTQSKLSVPAT